MKKAFTLAEILIVLTVIGTIAAITIPQLTGGTDEAQMKAGLKKAYATVVNITSMLKADESLPTTNNAEAVSDIFKTLNENLDVEGYVSSQVATAGIDSGTKVTPDQISQGLTWGETTFGDSDSAAEDESTVGSGWSPWIIAADGMAFSVLKGTGESGCSKKSAINNVTTTAEGANNAACVIVAVDTNGVEKLPNKLEAQTAGLASTDKTAKLSGDRYYIYIAKDGAAKGSALTTITGRILAGVK